MLVYQPKQCKKNARLGSCRREVARLSQSLQILFSWDSALLPSSEDHTVYLLAVLWKSKRVKIWSSA